MESARPRLRAARRTALAGAAATGLMLTAAVPVHASPAKTRNPCAVYHDLAQQPVAAVIADVEAPGSELCHVGKLTLTVYRNDVPYWSETDWRALNFVYYCVTTELTKWQTNWDAPIYLNCG